MSKDSLKIPHTDKDLVPNPIPKEQKNDVSPLDSDELDPISTKSPEIFNQENAIKDDDESIHTPEIVDRKTEDMPKIYEGQKIKDKLPPDEKPPAKSDPIPTEPPKVLHTEKEVFENLPKKGHILFFHNMGTRSHLIALSALAEGLVQHGHKVTAVWYAKSKIVHENYKEILIEDK